MFSVACSGCPFTLYCLGKIELINRPDLISRLVGCVWSKVKDTVCYEIPLYNLGKKETIFGVIRKDLKRKIEFYDDLARLRKTEFEDNYLFLCNDKGMADRIVRNEVKNWFRECKDSINLVYVSSEISVVSNSNLLVRVTFDYNEKLIEAQIKLVLSIVGAVEKGFIPST